MNRNIEGTVYGYIVIITFLLLGFFSTGQLEAQKNYVEGWVILETGDTLYGSILDREISTFGTKLYKKIRVKTVSGKRRKFTARQISGYRKGEVDYESHWYHETMDFFIMKYISQAGLGEQIFLKVMKKGELSCYLKEYVDADNGTIDGFELFKREGEFYFVRATQGIFGLKEKRLTEYFRNCPEIIKKMNAGELNTPLEIVNYYNRYCNKQHIII